VAQAEEHADAPVPPLWCARTASGHADHDERDELAPVQLIKLRPIPHRDFASQDIGPAGINQRA